MPGVEATGNETIRLDLDIEVKPDALVRIETACGGQSRIGDDDYLEGARELIVEMAASEPRVSAAVLLTVKALLEDRPAEVLKAQRQRLVTQAHTTIIELLQEQHDSCARLVS